MGGPGSGRRRHRTVGFWDKREHKLADKLIAAGHGNLRYSELSAMVKSGKAPQVVRLAVIARKGLNAAKAFQERQTSAKNLVKFKNKFG